MPRLLRIMALGATVFGAPAALADQFHYNNHLIGPRAMGMGGAFAALADDASGVYYNPAGLAYALANDISGSANAFYAKRVTYDKVFDDAPFVEESEGSVAPFFGGLQKLDRYVPGLVAAFGVYFPDSELKDQNTTIKDKTIGSASVEYYHRTSNARASTMYGGAAAGYRLTPQVAVGFGLSYLNISELVQEYQDSETVVESGSGATRRVVWNFQALNLREQLTVYGVQPTLGMQMSFPIGLSLGLTLRQSFVASQSLTRSVDRQLGALTSEEQLTIMRAGRVLAAGSLGNGAADEKFDKPVGTLPFEARLGLAWFASPSLIWATDLAYHGATTDAEVIASAGNRAVYNREAVLNAHTGLEWYVVPSFPLRMGLFTNRDARPKVNKLDPNNPNDTVSCSDASPENADRRKKYCAQPDHIDYAGASLFIAWVQPNAQTSIGSIYQYGTGDASKLGDTKTQSVKGTSLTFAFSATTNL